MSYIGNSPGVASQRVVTTFTATSGQTTFTPTSGYTLGYCDVFFNGVKLVAGDDYTAADGVSVVLASGAAAGDVIEVVAHFPRGLTDGYLKVESDARFLSLGGGSLTGGLNVAGTVNAQGLQAAGTASLSFSASKWMVQNEGSSVMRSYACGADTSTFGIWEHYTAKSNGSPVLGFRLDGSGNMGVGTSSNSWGSGYRAIQTVDGTGGAFVGSGYAAYVVSNAYNNGTNWIRSGASYGSSLYSAFNGTHTWFIAGAGTAGSSFTFNQALTVDGSGNLIASTATSRISKLGAVTSINLGTGDTIGDSTSTVYIGGDSGATAFHIRMYNGGYYYPFKLSNTGNAMIGGITAPIAIPAGSVKLSVNGNTAQYGTDGYSVGGRTFLRFGLTVNTTYTVTIALGDSVYALADIRVGAYCGAGSGKANAHFAYAGHVGAYHMNTVYNSFSGTVTVGSPTISGNNIVFTISIANAGQNGIAMIQVIDVNGTTGTVSSISVA